MTPVDHGVGLSQETSNNMLDTNTILSIRHTGVFSDYFFIVQTFDGHCEGATDDTTIDADSFVRDRIGRLFKSY